MLLLMLSALVIPAIAAGGNGGSSGSDGAGSGESGGSGGSGNGSDQAGNTGSGSSKSGPEGSQAPVLQPEQQGKPQETPEKQGDQVNQQDRNQTEIRTNISVPVQTTNPDLLRQRDRDLFLQQVSQQEQNLSRDQDRDQAQVDVALYALSISGNVTGSAGQEISRLASEINTSLAATVQAEQQIQGRNSFIRVLLGGDQAAAGLLIQYADQNQQRIQQMEQLLANCSDCDPQVRVMLEEQVQALSREQGRLTSLAQQEQADKGLFGWILGGSASPSGTGQVAVLTTDEKYWLTYMREEEKLARDVYLSLGTKWNLPIFSNIAQSEQTHMDIVKTLLDKYGIPDPTAGKAQGAFTSPDLQKLYDTLIAQGSISPAEALRVGVLIEETDITDLNKAIATTQHNDIRTMYSNLLQGSQNHLSAYETNLARY